MVYARGGRFNHQVRNNRSEPRQRIDFQDVGLEVVVDIQTEIHARHVQRAGAVQDHVRQVARGAVRAVMECAGITDVLTKSMGSATAVNVVRATVDALKQLEDPEEIAARRGLSVQEVTPDALLAEAKTYAESAVGEAARRAMVAQDPAGAASIIARQAEFDAIGAAREGARRGRGGFIGGRG